MTESTLLLPAEVAEQLRVHINTVYNWANNGTLTPVRVGRSLRFRREDIERLVERTPQP